MKQISACAWCKRVTFRGRAIPGTGLLYRFFRSHGICLFDAVKLELEALKKKLKQDEFMMVKNLSG
jgi:hypothetical protein